MKTSITTQNLQTHQGKEADRILRNCVHCGFCNATCPTYQLTGDELDGPRGRIYLIKQVLEGHKPHTHTQLHLDRCLTCRNCETTCPSGVDYGRLFDIGRKLVSEQSKRSITSRLKRYVLRKFFLTRSLFHPAIRLAQSIRLILPASIKQKIPAKQRHLLQWPQSEHERKVILLQGCVQPALQPNIDRAAAVVLDRMGVQVLRLEDGGCCGAISHHMNAFDEAHDYIKKNIDAWWPYIEKQQVEAILSTASGCGVTIKDYKHILADDAKYRDKAETVSALCKDLSEIIDTGALPVSEQSSPEQSSRAIAFHPPCTLQHGQQLNGKVEAILSANGHRLVAFKDSHLCCGSAGTYSVLQKSLATRLRNNKLQHIEHSHPDIIVTANIGCLLHLQSGTRVPVKHWIELLV